MTAQRRIIWELAVVIIGLCGCVAWGLSSLRAARHAAHLAARDLEVCRQAALRIEQLRQRPTIAGVQERQAAETATQVEKAAGTAGIDTAKSLVSISPETPRRLGDTAYKEAPTQVLLRDVTMAQLVRFLRIVCDAQGLQARSIRLSAPREDTGEQWTVEVSLSYLIYAPAKETTERGG